MGSPNGQLLSKIQVFYRPEWTKGGTTWKWILTIFIYKNESYKQIDGKNRWKYRRLELRSFNSPKKCIFCNFVITSARNLSLLKQVTSMHLKVLNTLFQKKIWFIGVWATVHDILAIKILKKMLTQQKSNKMLQFQTAVSSKH